MCAEVWATHRIGPADLSPTDPEHQVTPMGTHQSLEGALAKMVLKEFYGWEGKENEQSHREGIMEKTWVLEQKRLLKPIKCI